MKHLLLITCQYMLCVIWAIVISKCDILIIFHWIIVLKSKLWKIQKRNNIQLKLPRLALYFFFMSTRFEKRPLKIAWLTKRCSRHSLLSLSTLGLLICSCILHFRFFNIYISLIWRVILFFSFINNRDGSRKKAVIYCSMKNKKKLIKICRWIKFADLLRVSKNG